MKTNAERDFREVVGGLISMSGILDNTQLQSQAMPMPMPRGMGQFEDPAMLDPSFFDISGRLSETENSMQPRIQGGTTTDPMEDETGLLIDEA